MMEMETLNRKSLLYGCRTGQWFVNLFNVIENQRESETGQTKYVFNEMCVGNLIFMLLKTTNRISVNYLKWIILDWALALRDWEGFGTKIRKLIFLVIQKKAILLREKLNGLASRWCHGPYKIFRISGFSLNQL